MKPLIDETTEIKRELSALEERLSSREHEIKDAEFSNVSKEEIKRIHTNHEQDKAMARDLDKQLQAIAGRTDEMHRTMVNLERTVLTLSTGALALTVTFSRSLVPATPESIALLQWSWISLTGAIVAFPLGTLAELGGELGMRPRRLVSIFAILIPSLGFGLFLSGIMLFLLFALKNIPVA